jgi:hypothetical protein
MAITTVSKISAAIGQKQTRRKFKIKGGTIMTRGKKKKNSKKSMTRGKKKKR